MTSKPPVPAFYACYLLRSTVRHQSLYVGSTPNPVRRLKQHNGVTRGGAVRTSRVTLRPWEMVCLVTGFPSKVAALQFEWAWQNTHLTRHINSDERLTHATTYNSLNRRTGTYRKKTARPSFSLTERLANLHLLLRSNSFERWPLKVTFYAADVFESWQKWVRDYAGELRSEIETQLCDPHGALEADSLADPEQASGIQALEVTYKNLKPQLMKTKALFSSGDLLKCAVCANNLPRHGQMTVVCNHAECNAASHIQCLSSKFISEASDHTAVLPSTGHCPTCSDKLHWVDLVKEMSLRMRSPDTVEKVLRKRNPRKSNSEKSRASSVSLEVCNDYDDDMSSDQGDNGEEEEGGEGEEWHSLDDDDAT